MTLSIPGHLYSDVMRLVDESGYSVEDAIAKAAAHAARSAKTTPRSAEATKRKEIPATAEPARVAIIRVPMAPPSVLLPNRAAKQSHWSPRAKAREVCRETAKYAALDMAPPSPFPGPVHLTMHIAYGVDPATRRARNLPDLDGSIAAAKSLIDGIVDAGIIYDDDQIVRITASHERLPVTRKHRPDGFTVVQIEEVEG